MFLFLVYEKMRKMNPIFHSVFLVFIIPLILLLFERCLASLTSLQNIRSLSLKRTNHLKKYVDGL